MHGSGQNRIYVALAVAALACGVRIARADDAQNNQQLQQKVDQLEAKVQALETQQQNNDSNTMQARTPTDNRSWIYWADRLKRINRIDWINRKHRTYRIDWKHW